MSEPISIAPSPHEVNTETGRRHHFFGGATLVLVIGLLGLVIAILAVGIVGAAPVPEPVFAESVPTYPRRELPREWQWEPPPVEYKHMYRSKKSRRDLDWIR